MKTFNNTAAAALVAMGLLMTACGPRLEDQMLGHRKVTSTLTWDDGSGPHTQNPFRSDYLIAESSGEWSFDNQFAGCVLPTGWNSQTGSIDALNPKWCSIELENGAQMLILPMSGTGKLSRTELESTLEGVMYLVPAGAEGISNIPGRYPAPGSKIQLTGGKYKIEIHQQP